MKIEIYVDGSCIGNPGNGGYAAILLAFNDNDELVKQHNVWGTVPKTTNNKMEIIAAIEGLNALKVKPTKVTIYSDSQYLIKTATGEWNGNKNRELFQELAVLTTIHDVTWQWVRGHAGNKWNELAHTVAYNAAMELESEKAS